MVHFRIPRFEWFCLEARPVKIMFLSVQTGSSICLKGCHGNKLTVVKKWIRKAKRTKVKVINPRNMLLQIDQGEEL